MCLHPRRRGKGAKCSGLMIGVWVENQDSPTDSQSWASAPQAVKKWEDLEAFYRIPPNGCFCPDRERGRRAIMAGMVKVTTGSPVT